MNILLNDYTSEKMCEYKSRIYSVRDNGAIMRHPIEGKRASKLDCVWTFGKKNAITGYMEYGGVRVHQVVATAYYGKPDDPNLVIDHIDTNRCNNRPDNLKWVTRLENVLNNPITRHKIIYRCGSVEAFLQNPAILRESSCEPNIKWMRTVSREEAAKCLRNLSRWAREDRIMTYASTSSNDEESGDRVFEEEMKKAYGENKLYQNSWRFNEVYSTIERIEGMELNFNTTSQTESITNESLTPGAKQRNWIVPTMFPLCPSNQIESPLNEYYLRLKKGEIFCRNYYGESIIEKAEMSDDNKLIEIISYSSSAKGNGGFFLNSVSFEDGYFIHESRGSYFEMNGAEKYFELDLGREWTGGEVFDDYC